MEVYINGKRQRTEVARFRQQRRHVDVAWILDWRIVDARLAQQRIADDNRVVSSSPRTQTRTRMRISSDRAEPRRLWRRLETGSLSQAEAE